MLVGVPVTLGLAVFCITGGVAIGALGRRVERREVATGTVLAFATALGVLFSSLASEQTSTITNVLFGNLLAISDDQLVVFAVVTLVELIALAAIARPLLFASVNAEVAEARGLPVRALGVAFMVLLALAVTMAVQVVGTLLLFALVVTPAATALLLTARPAIVAALSAAIAVAAVWLGLVSSAMFNLPPSFPVVALLVAGWGAALVTTRAAGASASRSTPTTTTTASRSRPTTPDRRGQPAAVCRASTSRSPRERSTSFRCVQVDTPRSSRRTCSRTSPRRSPTTRCALPTAAGHSCHGSTSAAHCNSPIVRVARSTVPRTSYSWTPRSTQCSSAWLSRKCTSKQAIPASGAQRSRRRRRRMPCGPSGS